MKGIYRSPRDNVVAVGIVAVLCCAAIQACLAFSPEVIHYHQMHMSGKSNRTFRHDRIISSTTTNMREETNTKQIPGQPLLASKQHMDATTQGDRSTSISSSLSKSSPSISKSSPSSSSSSTALSSSSSSLSPVEAWCATHMNVWYDKSLNVKCPFFRRRMTDFLDGADMVMRFLIIRHKSLPLIGPPPGCRSNASSGEKLKHQSLETLMELIRADWQSTSNTFASPHKGYYITGKLNTAIYRDDCWFDGPDPDMPVRGVRKYLNAAGQLFDKSTSTAELLTIEIQHSQTKQPTIVAKWKLKGVLQLPWHPSVPTWTGTTIYHLDEDRLVHKHEELWDISVAQAFTQTLWPQLGNLLWKIKQ